MAKILIPVSPSGSRKVLASVRAPTQNQKRCGVSIISIGPGLRPWMYRAPMMTAVTASPGIPRVIIGMLSPPMQALFAVSGAMTPS